jgi:hypothetical protein
VSSRTRNSTFGRAEPEAQPVLDAAAARSGDRLGGCRRRLDRDREDDDVRVELQPEYRVELPGR